MNSIPMVFPVRFATPTTAVQTTTRELGRNRVFICCLQPPEVGALVNVKLYLPGVRDGVQTKAVVRELAEPGKEAGFWADFIEIGAAEQAHIGEAIARRQRAAESKPIGAIALQPAEDPRRAFPRVNARFEVRFATVQDFVLQYAANISAGGVFVQTDDPPLLETVVKVEMDLPGSGPVQASGRVVHRVSKEDASLRGTPPGMGVQFVDASDEFREKIDMAIEYILQQNQKP
jgi:uncharacterized protein (TIGR02266 family)